MLEIKCAILQCRTFSYILQKSIFFPEQKKAMIEAFRNQLRINLHPQFSSFFMTERWVYNRDRVKIQNVCACVCIVFNHLGGYWSVCVGISTQWWQYQAIITRIWTRLKSSRRLCPTSCKPKCSRRQPAQTASYKLQKHSLKSCCTVVYNLLHSKKKK